MNSFTRRKFLQLELKQQHKKCAELLRQLYESFSEEKKLSYEELTRWMKIPRSLPADRKLLADQYHWHLQQAQLSLKEHNLLAPIRLRDRQTGEPFLPCAIYLDNLRSAYNVGSILRTAEALRIGSVYFGAKTPFIDNEKVQRTAMGAAELVPCFQNVPLAALPSPRIALETSDEAADLGHFSFPASFTLILGNEECGVSDEALTLCDAIVTIPVFGAKNSINVACAFAMAALRIRTTTRTLRN